MLAALAVQPQSLPKINPLLQLQEATEVNKPW
jgi:hypothetical protein